jgi:hypothetical protein
LKRLSIGKLEIDKKLSKEKRIEQEIAWYKIIFAIFTATDISLLAWFVQNFETTKQSILILCSIAVIIVTVILVLINQHVFKCLDDLEEL